MTRYIGRFAPSPTGPLHIGSLIAALASYLDARACGGVWKLRIDDIDATRCKLAFADQIKTCLQNFGLHWDGDATSQQIRAGNADDTGAYADALQRLDVKKTVYACICSRKEIADSVLFLPASTLADMAEGPRYSGVCRHQNYALTHPQSGVRLNVGDAKIAFQDRIQGEHSHGLATTCGDFILKRKDGLFSYQLSVVVDDYLEGITHIVRGADLLASTPRQIYLQQLLGYPTPAYAHLPVALTLAGEKLSKQTLAPALPLQPTLAEATDTIVSCLRFLSQSTDGLAQISDTAKLLKIAAARWNISAIPPREGCIWAP